MDYKTIFGYMTQFFIYVILIKYDMIDVKTTLKSEKGGVNSF